MLGECLAALDVEEVFWNVWNGAVHAVAHDEDEVTTIISKKRKEDTYAA